MVPANSAQREPSMEEILASIRRIIEDNDSGKKPDDAETLKPAAASFAPAAGTVIEVDAFRSELRASPVEPMEALHRLSPEQDIAPEPRPAQDQKPVSLAEVQAQIAAESRVGDPARWAKPASSLPEKPAVRDEVEESMKIAAEQSIASEDVSVVQIDKRYVGGIVDVEPLPKPADTFAAPVATHPQPAGDSDAPKMPILSEQAERKVAAAFGELSDAFAARSKKTFDALAEEMMRPMLQDWLDNNLPLLVERLVREEIERIARGA